MHPNGELHYFRSRVDGRFHPCAVCATDAGNEPKPLILEVSPGALSDLRGAVAQTEEIARIARESGRSCVVLRPTGRGPGSVYQNYGEVDVLEAIEYAASLHAVDRDRISVTGSSMGGAAVWYLISHYPDLFAGAAPFCGYCDYRLWEKPGGMTFHLHEWEEFSWRARSAALLVENLRHTPVWMVHGEWDRAVGGGVPVEHSRQMARLMGEKGYPHTYTEVPETGHGCRQPEIWQQVIPWLLDQRKVRDPQHVALATYDLRHNRSYWLTIEQLGHYGDRGLAEAGFSGPTRLVGRTENVRTFSLDPPGSRDPVAVSVDGQELGVHDISAGQAFRREPDGTWRVGAGDLSREKRHGSSGPTGDLFHDGLILVPGTAGSPEETFQASWVAEHARGYYRSRNGGVHRGGIMGENCVDLRIVPDRDLADGGPAEQNLLLFGTGESNSVLAGLADQLPVGFEGQTLHLTDRSYTADGVAVFAVFPHPGRPGNYVAVHGGVTPDAICWGSHLDMQLMPDYLVYAGGDVLDWGFWGNDWQSQP